MYEAADGTAWHPDRHTMPDGMLAYMKESYCTMCHHRKRLTEDAEQDDLPASTDASSIMQSQVATNTGDEELVMLRSTVGMHCQNLKPNKPCSHVCHV